MIQLIHILRRQLTKPLEQNLSLDLSDGSEKNSGFMMGLWWVYGGFIVKCLWNLTECDEMLWIYLTYNMNLYEDGSKATTPPFGYLFGWVNIQLYSPFFVFTKVQGFWPLQSPPHFGFFWSERTYLSNPTYLILSIDSSCDIFPYKNCWVKAVLHQLCDTFGEISWIFPRHLDWLDFKATQVAKSRPLRQNSGFFHITFGWFLDDFGMSKVTLW